MLTETSKARNDETPNTLQIIVAYKLTPFQFTCFQFSCQIKNSQDIVSQPSPCTVYQCSNQSPQCRCSNQSSQCIMKGSPCCAGLMWSCLHTYRTTTNLTQHIIQPWGGSSAKYGGVISQVWVGGSSTKYG